MTFNYRIKLYLFGFLLGLLILAIILKGKKCSSVNEMKLIEITDQTILLSDKAKCQLAYLKINQDTLRLFLQNNFRINYDKSEVRSIPCGKLFIEGKHKNMPFSLVILDCDTVSKIDEFILAEKHTQCDSIR
jgi:hypothetical protein